MILLIGCASLSTSVHAEVWRQHILDYFAASQQAVLAGAPWDIETLVTFMADDTEAHHVSYGAQSSGKDYYRENLPAKAATVLSLGRQTTETGKDGQLVSYSGRMVLTAKFNADNQLKKIRRYVVADFQR